jgi:hypothetical protein
LFTTRATVGCRWPEADGRSYGGILAAVKGGDFVVSGPGFTARDADVAFWSRSRSGWRETTEVAVAGQAAAVVVMRAVLLPAAVVLVVKIPAAGLFLAVSGGDNLRLPAALAVAWDTGRFDAAGLRVVVEGGDIASKNNPGLGSPARREVCRLNPDSVFGPF